MIEAPTHKHSEPLLSWTYPKPCQLGHWSPYRTTTMCLALAWLEPAQMLGGDKQRPGKSSFTESQCLDNSCCLQKSLQIYQSLALF